jgi:hypothetical protein
MAQIGAFFYVVWGLLHIFAASQVYKLGTRQTPGMVQGRIYQSAWNLAFAAVFTIGIAVVYNWVNAPLGFWLNLLLTSVTDLGFIAFILLPKQLPLKAALPGPTLWIIAVIFSTLGQVLVHP